MEVDVKCYSVLAIIFSICRTSTSLPEETLLMEIVKKGNYLRVTSKL